MPTKDVPCGSLGWVFSNIAPDQIFIKCFLLIPDYPFYYQVVGYMGSTKGAVNTILYLLDVLFGESFDVFFIKVNIKFL